MHKDDKEKEKSIETANYLYNQGYLSSLGQCSCGGNQFKIYKVPNYKLNCVHLSAPLQNEGKNILSLLIPFTKIFLIIN